MTFATCSMASSTTIMYSITSLSACERIKNGTPQVLRLLMMSFARRVYLAVDGCEGEEEEIAREDQGVQQEHYHEGGQHRGNDVESVEFALFPILGPSTQRCMRSF
jgi:hypothetical protein